MGGASFALNAIELVVFTTLAPAAAVAYAIVAGRFLVCHARRDDRTPPPSSVLFVPLAIVTVGFIVSATHLGNPSNALYVLRRVGQAGLSTEVFCTAVFLCTGGLFWIASLLKRPPKPLENLWLALTIVAAAGYLASTTRVYCMPTIPTWNTVEAQVSLVLSALAGGTLLGCACLALGPEPPRAAGRRGLLATSMVCTCATCGVLVLQHQAIAPMRNVFGSALDFAPHYLPAVAVYGCALLAAAALMWWGLGAGRAGASEMQRAGASGAGVPSRAGTPGRADAPAHANAPGVSGTNRANVGRRATLVASVVLMYLATFLIRFQFYSTYLSLS